LRCDGHHKSALSFTAEHTFPERPIGRKALSRADVQRRPYNPTV
jgi:hypothetical protein